MDIILIPISVVLAVSYADNGQLAINSCPVFKADHCLSLWTPSNTPYLDRTHLDGQAGLFDDTFTCVLLAGYYILKAETRLD